MVSSSSEGKENCIPRASEEQILKFLDYEQYDSVFIDESPDRFRIKVEEIISQNYDLGLAQWLAVRCKDGLPHQDMWLPGDEEIRNLWKSDADEGCSESEVVDRDSVVDSSESEDSENAFPTPNTLPRGALVRWAERTATP